MAHAFTDPRAVVRCMACAFDGQKEIFGLGVIRGMIAEAPRGHGGFGWDSVFIPEGSGGRSYGEMPPAEKNAISHRRRALEALKQALSEG